MRVNLFVFFMLSMLLHAPLVSAEAFHCEQFTAEEKQDCQSNEVKAFLQSWVDSWSQGDLQAYLDHYVAGESPKADLTYDEWLGIRRSRVKADAHIDITLELGSMGLDDDISDVIFTQKYSSASFSEESRKKLLLVREQGELKIRQEITLE